MANFPHSATAPTSPAKMTASHRPLDPLAGLLSYLVPGLGQIYQGRIAKGILFLFAIYILFFYGLFLGQGEVTIGPRTYRLTSNVYLPNTVDETAGPDRTTTVTIRGRPIPIPSSLYNRLQFGGQFFVGIVAWPAIFQYMDYDRQAVEDLERQIDHLYSEVEQFQRTNEPDRAEEKLLEVHQLERDPRLRHPLFGTFMREPSASATNAVHNAGDKRLELAWVYTVIAGVLNIMVIYDAVAGPAFSDSGKEGHKKPTSEGDHAVGA